MQNEPTGLVIQWNEKWYQIHYHNDTENVVIHEISEFVASIYEKRKYKGRVYEAFIPSYQNERHFMNTEELLPDPPAPDMKG